MTCYQCKRKANMQLFKRGLERWLYDFYPRNYPSQPLRKRWMCGECWIKEGGTLE